MGFYEDDRIRSKNKAITQENSTPKLAIDDSVSISELADILVRNGYKIDLRNGHIVVLKK